MTTSLSTKAAIVRTIVVLVLLAAMAWIAKRFLVDGGDPMPRKPGTQASPTAPA